MVVFCFPRIVSFSDEGIIILRLNVSVPSTILSLFIGGMLIVVLLVPAVKVALIGVEV